jgi:hypothetical protein
MASLDSLHSLGDLHDSRITSLHWSMTERALTLQIDDFFANFLGLPEYPGQQSGPLTFHDVAALARDTAATDSYLWIYEVSIIPSPKESLSVTIRLAPGGCLSFTCTRFILPPTVETFMPRHQ